MSGMNLAVSTVYAGRGFALAQVVKADSNVNAEQKGTEQ